MDKPSYNSQKHLIINEKNEVLEGISFFQFTWNKINIQFSNSDKVYSYNINSINFLKDPKNVNISTSLLYCEGKILSSPKMVLCFWDKYYRVFLEDWKVVTSNKIKVVKDLMKDEKVLSIIEYLSLIHI